MANFIILFRFLQGDFFEEFHTKSTKIRRSQSWRERLLFKDYAWASR